jgi:hypothetical protein
MANFHGTARTNYFRVKDIEVFKKEIKGIPSLRLIEDNEGRVGFVSECPDSGTFPSYAWNEETDEAVDIDLCGMVADHLAEGEVAVLIEAGAEKLRYISGWATAVNHQGKTVTIRLSDIYNAAEKIFGVRPTLAEY